jgi:hypothetical protein
MQIRFFRLRLADGFASPAVRTPFRLPPGVGAVIQDVNNSS